MLAPVNKLWTTPTKAVERGLELLQLNSSSQLLDPGCGDGRVLLRAAVQYGCKCSGYEINQSRASQTALEVQDAGLAHLIDVFPSSSLEADFSSFDSVFGFLVERGLRKVVPLLLAASIDKRKMMRAPDADITPEVTSTPGDAAGASGTGSGDSTAHAASSAAPATNQGLASDKGDQPLMKLLSVLYKVPRGVCCDPVRIEWVRSSDLVKTPVYLYHFYGDERDLPIQAEQNVK